VSRLLRPFRDAWCAITKRCRWDRPETPTVQWLKAEEHASRRSVQEIRLRRNFMEQELVRRREGSS
jgi:hypothetical protein